jgi:predicted nucleic-acid-binding Zn-ribbon protein
MFTRWLPPQKLQSKTKMNCIACGSTNLVEGNILDESGGTKLNFKPLEVSIWKAVLGIGVRKISVAACVHCGHLQMNVNFSDVDKQHHLKFEGEQPDLLKRIESES